MDSFARRIVGDRRFERLIIALIVFNGVLVGLETSATVVARAGTLIEWAHHLILAVFVAEVCLKLAAVSPAWRRYFGDGWNLFDFTVVVLSLLPFSGELAMVARLVRLLRVLRLVSALPRLRMVVATLVHALPGMGHVLMLVALLFYIYAVAGFHLFHTDDPERWGSLGAALLTLFQIATLEGWAEVMRSAMETMPWAWLYFISFVIVGTFVMINLFVAVVINSLDESKAIQASRDDAEAGPGTDAALLAELRAARETLARVEARLSARTP
ncbi:MAG: ion transporter [bacterium]|jgi:voltage-gated sodium channel|nr:ion transporter [Betaproteobacteria bacterium]